MALWHVPGVGIVNDAEQGVPEGATRLPEYRNALQFGGQPFQWDPRLQAQGGQPWQGMPETAPGYLTELLGLRERVRTGQAQPWEVEQYRQWETEARAIPTRDIGSLQAGWGGDQNWWQSLDPLSPDVGPIALTIQDRIEQGQASPQEQALFEQVMQMAGDWNTRASVPQASDAFNPMGDQFFQAVAALSAAAGGAASYGAFGAGAAGAGGAGGSLAGIPTSTLSTIGNVAQAGSLAAQTGGDILDQDWLRQAGGALGLASTLSGGAAALGNLTSGAGSAGGLLGGLLGGSDTMSTLGNILNLGTALAGLGTSIYGAVNAGSNQAPATAAANQQIAFAQQQAAFQQQILARLLAQQEQNAAQVAPIRQSMIDDLSWWEQTGNRPAQLNVPRVEWGDIGRQSAWDQPGAAGLANFMRGGALPTAAQGPGFREYQAPGFQSLLANQATWAPQAVQGYTRPAYATPLSYQTPAYQQSRDYVAPAYQRPGAYQAPTYQQAPGYREAAGYQAPTFDPYNVATREQTEMQYRRAREQIMAQSGGQPGGVLARRLQELEIARNSQLAANRQAEVERQNVYDLQNAQFGAQFGAQQANAFNQYGAQRADARNQFNAQNAQFGASLDTAQAQALNQYNAQNAQFGAGLNAQQINALNQYNAQNAQFTYGLHTQQANAYNQWIAQQEQFRQAQGQQATQALNAQNLAYTQGLQNLVAQEAGQFNQFNLNNAQFAAQNYNNYRQQMAAIGANLYGTGLQYGQNEAQAANEQARWNALNRFNANSMYNYNVLLPQQNQLFNAQLQLATGLPQLQQQGLLGAGSMLGNPGTNFGAAGNLFQNIGTATGAAQQGAGQAIGATLGSPTFQGLLTNALQGLFGPNLNDTSSGQFVG